MTNLKRETAGSTKNCRRLGRYGLGLKKGKQYCSSRVMTRDPRVGSASHQILRVGSDQDVLKISRIGSGRPYPTRPDPTRPDPTRPDSTRPDPTLPDPTRPNHNSTRPDLTGEVRLDSFFEIPLFQKPTGERTINLKGRMRRKT